MNMTGQPAGSNPAGLDLARRWTAQVLSFAMENSARPDPLPPLDGPGLDRLAQRARRLLEGSGKSGLVLVGLGSGAALRHLAAALPDRPLLCLEPLPERARTWLQGTSLPDGTALPDQAALLADASPYALACLAELCGLGPDRAVALLNPEVSGPEAQQIREAKQIRETQRFWARLRPAARNDLADAPAGSLADLSCAAILSPDEPDLDGFFEQFPSGIRELVLVWDAEQAPDISLPDRFPVRQLAHPLGKDFAAQRNRMLAACTGSWVLSLDADERLAPGLWPHLPGLMRPEWAGVLLPRLTLFPDADHFRMGFGLWPDLQLRLYRRSPKAAYVRPIHETLEGLDGPLALLPDRPILHLTHLAKRPQAIRDKLAGFNAVWTATGGAVRHTLNEDFPHLPMAPPFLPTDPALPPRVLLLGGAEASGRGVASSPVAPVGEGV